MIYRDEMQIVADAVERVSGQKVTVEMMLNKSRKREVVAARHVFMYLMRKRKEKFSWRECAGFLGKDHATAIHAYKTVTNLLQQKDHLYVGAMQCAEEFEDSMDGTLISLATNRWAHYLSSTRRQKEAEEVKSKLQEAIEVEQHKRKAAVALLEWKIRRILEVLQECKVQGWVMHKVRSELEKP